MELSAELQQILDFVEGRTAAQEFELQLYSNPSFEAVLNDNAGVSLNDKIWSNLYLFVIEQNFNTPGGVLNAHAILAEFLQRKGIETRPFGTFQPDSLRPTPMARRG